MKQLVLLLQLICLLTYCSQHTTEKKAVTHQSVVDFLSVDSIDYDFGAIDSKEEVLLHTFLLSNVGNDTIIMDSYDTGCSCLLVKYNRDTIMPEDTAAVNLYYFHTKQDSSFHKTILLFFNNRKYYLPLSIHGEFSCSIINKRKVNSV